MNLCSYMYITMLEVLYYARGYPILYIYIYAYIYIQRWTRGPETGSYYVYMRDPASHFYGLRLDICRLQTERQSVCVCT